MNITDHKSYPWLLVVFYSLLGIFFPAAVTQFCMVVSDLAEALHVEERIILLADSSRAVCLVCAMFLSSYVYKRFGLRKTMALGLAFQILPQFFIPLAVRFQCLPMFFVLKGMQGLNAMAFPLYISTITLWISERYVALATAIFNGSFIAGSGVGAWISGKIVPILGWQSSFFAIGGLCLFLAIPVLLITRDKIAYSAAPELSEDVDSRKAKRAVYGPIVRQPITWILVITLIANTWVAQAVTVDMSVYANSIGFNYGQTGNLMLAISVVTVVSSVLAGAVSDWFAARAKNKVRNRSFIMGLGYLLSAVSAFFLPFVARTGYMSLMLTSCLMMFGASWGAGVFWALPVEVYSPEDNVAGTAFCSGAANVPNPIAPMVVGVILGSAGMWTEGWLTCAAVSLLSMIACLALMRFKGRTA